FKLSGAAGRRRAVLARVLDEKNVVDGVIQGEAIRLVMKNASDPSDVFSPIGGPDARIAPAPPRFEDAFVDMLGGGPGGRSKLAEATQARPADVERPVIEAKGLTKKFGDFTAAADITFSVPRGEIFGLLGPNGAGKSTTFKMLCGLLKPTLGEGRVAGFELRRDGAEARNRLGYMAQKFSLYGDLSVSHTLALFARVYGFAVALKSPRAALMTKIFDLRPHTNSFAKD